MAIIGPRSVTIRAPLQMTRTSRREMGSIYALRAWTTLLKRLIYDSKYTKKTEFHVLFKSFDSFVAPLKYVQCSRVVLGHGRHTYPHGNGGPWFVTFRAPIKGFKFHKENGFHVLRALIYVGASIEYVNVLVLYSVMGTSHTFLKGMPITMAMGPSFIKLLGPQHMTQGSQRGWSSMFWELWFIWWSCVVLGHGNISNNLIGHAYHHGNGSIIHRIIRAPTYGSKFAMRLEFHVFESFDSFVAPLEYVWCSRVVLGHGGTVYTSWGIPITTAMEVHDLSHY